MMDYAIEHLLFILLEPQISYGMRDGNYTSALINFKLRISYWEICKSTQNFGIVCKIKI